MVLDLLWTGQTSNSKTGNLITAWVGSTKEETGKSCEGCSLYKNNPSDKFQCYAWTGMVNVGLGIVQKAAKLNPSKYTLENALATRSKTAKAARLTSIGDAGALPYKLVSKYINRIKKEGLSILFYTHKWRKLTKSWSKFAMASCDNLSEADEAADKGWRASVVLDPSTIKLKRLTTPKGRTVIICPAMRAGELNMKAVDCNNCRLCDASRLDSNIHIGFPMHGPAAKGKKLKVL